MKKILAVVVLLAFAFTAFAEESPFDAGAYKEGSMNFLTGWAGASMVSGLGMTIGGNTLVRGIGIQSIAWGAIDLGIALYVKDADNVFGIDLNTPKGLYDIFFINTLLDILYMAAGAGLLIWGSEELKGHGAGILIQGGFLFVFDGINAVILSTTF